MPPLALIPLVANHLKWSVDFKAKGIFDCFSESEVVHIWCDADSQQLFTAAAVTSLGHGMTHPVSHRGAWLALEMYTNSKMQPRRNDWNHPAE